MISNEYQKWIDKADADLAGAKILYIHNHLLKDLIVYHCQQATEKYLKAYLIKLNLSFRFTHDLLYLLDCISEKEEQVEIFYSDIRKLYFFSSDIRYPDSRVEITEVDLKESIEITEKIQKYILSKI